MIFLGEKALANKIDNLKPGDCPYTLFLGAGASISSGIPLTSNLVFRWKEKILLDLIKTNKEYKKINKDNWKENAQFYDHLEYGNYNHWKKKNNFRGESSDYSLLFSTLHQTPKERQLFIEELIDLKKPAFGYLFLAGLINQERFNRVLTTNFDDLLNDALFKWYGLKPINCAFDSMVSGIRIDSKRPKIIKLHGDFLYDNLKNIRNELKSLDSNMEDKMFEMCKDRGLIVVGYSGADTSVMNPINEMLRKNGYLEMGLHWCFIKQDVQNMKRIIEGKEEDEFVKEKYRDLLEMHRQYSNKVFFYEIDDFDSLMETMFEDCKCSPPEILESPNEVNPFKEFERAVLYQGVKRSVDLTELQQKYFFMFYDAQINKSNEEDDIKSYAEVYFSRGKSFRDKAKALDDLDERIDLLAIAMENYEKCITPLKTFMAKTELNIPNIEKQTLDHFIYAIKRLSGLYVAIGKVQYAIDSDKNKFNENLLEGLTFVEKGIDLMNILSQSEINEFRIDLRSLPYNGCCAISKFCENKNSIEKSDKTKIIRYFKINIDLCPDKSHAKKILQDSDCNFIVKKMGKELKAKFKL